MADDLRLQAGRLHIPAAIHADTLGACPAVALLVRDGDWLLLPLLSGAGGLQVKLRNPRGDRVVEAQEFFRQQGVEDDAAPRRLVLEPLPALGAFRLRYSVEQL